MVIGVAALVVAARRGDHPWSRSFRLYLWLGAAIVVVRVVFRVLFGGGDEGTVLLDLPEIPLPGWALGVHLLGPVTLEAMLFALYDGLRLADDRDLRRRGQQPGQPQAAAALDAGRASTRSAPPWSSLSPCCRSWPTACAGSAAAQRLRGGDTRRVGRLRRLVVPVLEDALERSLALAAGMDARGYGRADGADPRAAPGHRRPDAGGAVRALRRDLRRPGPHRPARARDAHAHARRGGGGGRPGRRRPAA